MKRDLLVHAGVAGLLAAAVAVAATTVSSLAEGSAGSPSVLVPITPCRLADTRAGAEGVGSRHTPLGAAETHTFAVWGTNGNCTIPSTATGIATNVTAVNPTSDGYLTVFPADAPRPLASNLNWTASSPPTPNQVTVGLSATGAVSAYNNGRSIDVIIDIVGYYEAEGAGGVPGPTGPQGPAGPPGPSGGGGLEPGQTVIAVAEYSLSSAGGLQMVQTIQLPFVNGESFFGSAGMAPDNSPATDTEDPQCTGSANDATAPPGRVCGYLLAARTDNAEHVGLIAGGGSVQVQWTATNSGTTKVALVWAFTPLG